MFHLRVAIVGAGPGGLTLARILHLAGIPFTIYELDPSKEHRYEQGEYRNIYLHMIFTLSSRWFSRSA